MSAWLFWRPSRLCRRPLAPRRSSRCTNRCAIVAGDLRENRLDEALKKNDKATSEEQGRRKKNRESWEKEKSDLEEDVADAELAQQRGLYWYRYGMLLGALLTAVGAFGYLRPQQFLIRRILGAVVLAALVLIVFNSFGQIGFHLGLGGR